MKLTCPYCRARLTVEEALREGDHAEFARLAATFGQHFRLVMEYVELWGPGPGRPPTLKKQVRILDEIARLWRAGEFGLGRRRYRIDRSGIVAALKTTVDAAPERIRSHNYLKRVMVKRSERLSAEGLTAREEQQREEKRRTGLYRDEDAPDRRELPPAVRAEVARLTGGSEAGG